MDSSIWYGLFESSPNLARDLRKRGNFPRRFSQTSGILTDEEFARIKSTGSVANVAHAPSSSFAVDSASPTPAFLRGTSLLPQVDRAVEGETQSTLRQLV
jgi:hypothetical protein